MAFFLVSKASDSYISYTTLADSGKFVSIGRNQPKHQSEMAGAFLKKIFDILVPFQLKYHTKTLFLVYPSTAISVSGDMTYPCH